MIQRNRACPRRPRIGGAGQHLAPARHLPTAAEEAHTSPDGTIVGRKLLQSSSDKNWDEAVLKAHDKTETMPRDVDGLVLPALVISFRPKD